MNNRKVILYIAASTDGYIAGTNDDLSFLDSVQAEGEDYGYNQFIAETDTIIVGRKTYDWVVNQVGDFGHSDKNVFVVTRTKKPKDKNVTFFSGSLTDLIYYLKKQKGKNIFCDGGAQVVNELLINKLIDEIIVSVIPVLLGEGISLFQAGRPKQELSLVSSKQFESGLVQLHYSVL